jgi:hypothetical protein
MTIEPRPPENLCHTYLFDEGCVKTWLTETTNKLISLYAMEDMEKMVDEQRRAFKTVTSYPLNEIDVREKFGEQARKEALKILEEERKNYVEFKLPYIKNTLEQVIKRLRNLVYAVDEKGKPFKLQIIVEKVQIVGSVGQGSPSMRDDVYVLDRDYERLNQIALVRGRVTEFEDYFPYMNEELTALYQTASSLGSLEYVTKEEKK